MDQIYPEKLSILGSNNISSDSIGENNTVGPIFRMICRVQPNVCENIGPISVRAGCKVSSFMLELMPNISDNLHLKIGSQSYLD
jgi:hypothetical protein